MSGLTLTRESLGMVSGTNDTGESTYVQIALEPKTVQDRAWQRFNFSLRRNLDRAGYEQPSELIEERPPSMDAWHIVAPGIIVRAAEYEARYSFLNLPEFRLRMSPEVFRAFVRHIGGIEGPDNVDVNQLSKEQDY